MNDGTINPSLVTQAYWREANSSLLKRSDSLLWMLP